MLVLSARARIRCASTDVIACRRSDRASLTCDDNGGGGTLSKIVSTALPAGDYWVALKGKAATSAGTYKLNITDMSATASGAIVQCDDNGGDTPSSLIERDMQAGTYQVVLKGKTAADKGAYKLSIRDITQQADHAAWLRQRRRRRHQLRIWRRSLAAGTYYAVLKGNNPTDKGAYSFSLRDVTNRPLSSTTCDDNGSTYNTSKITRTLDPGTYYVALKGKDANAKGPYQLSIGAGATHSSTYAPPLWSSTLARDSEHRGARDLDPVLPRRHRRSRQQRLATPATATRREPRPRRWPTRRTRSAPTCSRSSSTSTPNGTGPVDQRGQRHQRSWRSTSR